MKEFVVMSFPYPQGFQELIKKEDFLRRLAAIFFSWSFLPHDWDNRFKFGVSAPQLRVYITDKVSNRDFWYQKLHGMRGVYCKINIVNNVWDAGTSFKEGDFVIVITTAEEWRQRAGEQSRAQILVTDSTPWRTNDQLWEVIRSGIKKWMDTWF